MSPTYRQPVLRRILSAFLVAIPLCAIAGACALLVCVVWNPQIAVDIVMAAADWTLFEQWEEISPYTTHALRAARDVTPIEPRLHGDPPTDIGTFIFIRGGILEPGIPPNTPEYSRIRRYFSASRPAHPLFVRDFEIGKYEVTATEYVEFLNSVSPVDEDVHHYAIMLSDSTIELVDGEFVARERYEHAPAAPVTWEGGRRYCEWLTEKTGRRHRLPTELEWEYLAKGSANSIYPWGSEPTVDRGFFYEDHYAELGSPYSLFSPSPLELSLPRVWTVGCFPDGASPEGVMDLIGNATEWCGNCWAEDYSYPASSTDAEYDAYANPEDCEMAPTRGGQRYSMNIRPTSFARNTSATHVEKDGYPMDSDMGFRVLREVDQR